MIKIYFDGKEKKNNKVFVDVYTNSCDLNIDQIIPLT